MNKPYELHIFTARQPLEEDSDSSEEEEEDLDAMITMETDDGRDAFQDRADNFWDMSHEVKKAEDTSYDSFVIPKVARSILMFDVN